jgi:hypothetical protein
LFMDGPPAVIRLAQSRLASPVHAAGRAWRACLVAAAWALVACLLVLPPGAQAQGIELTSIKVARSEGALALDFFARPALSPAVEDAMQRGVPLYFVARATVYRSRWYWRDERIATAQRTWRVSYQPLTGNWRVSLGAIGQTATTAQEALAMVSRTTRWRIADLADVDPGEKHYVEFSYRLDSSQLPRPMQLDLAAQADWRLSVERTLKVE